MNKLVKTNDDGVVMSVEYNPSKGVVGDGYITNSNIPVLSDEDRENYKLIYKENEDVFEWKLLIRSEEPTESERISMLEDTMLFMLRGGM